jgi:hypothetical protein
VADREPHAVWVMFRMIVSSDRFSTRTSVLRETPEQTLFQFLNAVVDRSPLLLARVGQVSAEDPCI